MEAGLLVYAAACWWGLLLLLGSSSVAGVGGRGPMIVTVGASMMRSANATFSAAMRAASASAAAARLACEDDYKRDRQGG
jgi:hypothetical protein